MDASGVDYVLTEEKALQLRAAVHAWKPWLLRRSQFVEFTDDILSESFLVLVRKLPDMRGNDVKQFAFGIVRNVARSEIKKERRSSALIGNETVSPNVSPWLFNIRKHIDKLHHARRREVYLAFFAGYTPEELSADRLRRHSIANLKHRAISDLRARLGVKT